MDRLQPAATLSSNRNSPTFNFNACEFNFNFSSTSASTPPSNTFSTRTGSALLDLPVELRLQIYGFLFPPLMLAGPSEAYANLFLSCRNVKQELEGELARAMRAAFERLEKEHNVKIRATPPIKFGSKPLSTLARLRTLVLSFPVDVFIGKPFTFFTKSWSVVPDRVLLDTHRKLGLPDFPSGLSPLQIRALSRLPRPLSVLVRLDLLNLTIKYHDSSTALTKETPVVTQGLRKVMLGTSATQVLHSEFRNGLVRALFLLFDGKEGGLLRCRRVVAVFTGCRGYGGYLANMSTNHPGWEVSYEHGGEGGLAVARWERKVVGIGEGEGV
ncbi:hypothetical protein BCR34DRAFT_604038 [Clohesyomyces aquaticus]|uniref:Uncharacterized protein n=1 Tax=Clohesyomyces aquaticus TaxID=1231657 RepID=A0A1Y1Z9V5_9PLEO|nr:hypothetical protein BCR34DRAFT_604038 [Clohesyomyces aquaticus]